MERPLLIAGGTILTVNGANETIENGALLIEGRIIKDIGPAETLKARYPGVDRLDAAGSVVMPGLVNLHLHSGLIRGTAEDLQIGRASCRERV